MAKKRTGTVLLNIGVWAALLLALAGSLRHVAWAFATMENGNLAAGYVQATAIDAGLCVLALGVQVRRRQKRGSLALWVGVGVFSAISVFANYLHGVVHMAQIEAGPLASWRPVLMSAVLPVLVLYLSEVAGSDVNYTAQVQERQERREARRVSTTGTEDVQALSAEQARAAKAARDRNRKAAALDAMLDTWRTDPETGITEVARLAGISRTTAYTYRAELEQAGAIVRDNGHVQVRAEV